MVRFGTMRGPGKGTAVFCTATGTLMLVAWLFLLATGQVPGIRENALSFLFHWTAEFLTAVALIGAGIGILRRFAGYRSLYYFAMGLLVIAAGGAVVYYVLVDLNLAIVVGLALILACAKVLAWRHREGLSDLLFLLLGAVLYSELNIMGQALQVGEQSIVTYDALALALTVPVVVVALRRGAIS